MAAGLKSCRARGKKGHMAAACTIPKDKLQCKFCNSQNSHNTAACIKKQKADKEKEQGENNGKKDANPKPKSESQERRDASNERKRNLSLPKDKRSPVRNHNSCVQIRVQRMGNHPSDEDDYETPPETLDSDNDLEEENDDPNVPENSDEEISEDEDIDDLQNRPENDVAIIVGNLLNFPDLLHLNTSGQDTSNSEITHSDNEQFPPSKSCGARPKSPLPTGPWPRRRHPLLREVVLPQLTSHQVQKVSVFLHMTNHQN